MDFLEPNHHTLLHHPHVANEDKFFPFDKNFEKAPIDLPTKTLIDPPFLSVNNLYFENALEKTDKSVKGHISPLSVSEKRGLPIPQRHQEERRWQAITPAEMQHCVGFQHIVPDGTVKEPSSPPMFGPHLPGLITCEQKMRDYQPDTPDPRLRNRSGTRNHNTDEQSARALCMASKSMYAFTKEHPEERLLQLEHGCFDPDIPIREWQMKTKNFHPICPQNKQKVTLLSKMNLLDATQENNYDMIHFNALRIDVMKEPSILKFLEDRLTDSPYSYFEFDNLCAAAVAEFEIGSLQANGGLLMSMEHEKRIEIENIPFPYLSESSRYQYEKQRFENDGLVGPPLGNASQNLSMALWYDHQERNGYWTKAQIQEGKGLPLCHPSKLNLNHNQNLIT